MKSTHAGASRDPLSRLLPELQSLHESMLALEASHAQLLGGIAPSNKVSARNFLHYLAMRQRDLRAVQGTLASLGLSSLGRAEAAALSSVEAVLGLLERLRGEEPAQRAAAPCDLAAGRQLLDEHAQALFGPAPEGRSVRIMVTMPGEAANDYPLISGLLEAGMDCMRINCAHDSPAVWQKMIENLEHARKAVGRRCTVLMDLAGPKLRTGAIEAGPAVKKVRPSRDALGRVTAPGIIWLTAADAPSEPPSDAADATLQMAPDWLAALREGEELTFRDTRGRRRVLHAVNRDRGGVWAQISHTAYVANGTLLKRKSAASGEPEEAEVAGMKPKEGAIHLAPGDLLVLTRDPAPGREPSFDCAHRLLSPARVSCTLPEVFSSVLPGEPVRLDDGKLLGVVESASVAELHVRIQRTPPDGARLKADKGINFPDSDFELPAFTAKDREDLAFVAQHADFVGLSFVNRESDVLELIEQLRSLGRPSLGVILKIETRRGFERLPGLLLAAMRHARIGVMIARGDLAVECGYERLAEAQEEILWLCEAAHCPAIWATQVLETLARQGMPSRAEITDAAMGHRAECVMLNKGAHVSQAVHVLDDILRRMESHQTKKRAMLRALGLAMNFKRGTQTH